MIAHRYGHDQMIEQAVEHLLPALGATFGAISVRYDGSTEVGIHVPDLDPSARVVTIPRLKATPSASPRALLEQIVAPFRPLLAEREEVIVGRHWAVCDP